MVDNEENHGDVETTSGIIARQFNIGRAPAGVPRVRVEVFRATCNYRGGRRGGGERQPGQAPPSNIDLYVVLTERRLGGSI